MVTGWARPVLPPADSLTSSLASLPHNRYTQYPPFSFYFIIFFFFDNLYDVLLMVDSLRSGDTREGSGPPGEPFIPSQAGGRHPYSPNLGREGGQTYLHQGREGGQTYLHSRAREKEGLHFNYNEQVIIPGNICILNPFNFFIFHA